MEREPVARLTPTEGRRFGLTVGGAFLVLALISRWRGHALPPLVLGGVGMALVLAGLALPARLGPVRRAWMRLGLALSKITTPVFMALLYFLAITPVGLLMRAFGHRPLRARERDGGFWVEHEEPDDRSMTRQF
ncbi:MAG TPA: SxtJ family membrane protein [Gemmatimonadaceae bacterium]|nr:SxtJ family membrane protein [Gemmatimonadaceae bacterium]